MLTILRFAIFVASVISWSLSVNAVQLDVSYTDSLLELPISDFSFTDLTLPQVVNAISAKLGIPHGYIYNTNDRNMDVKQSLHMGRTTFNGVVKALQRRFPMYEIIVTGRTITAIPKDLNKSTLNWISQHTNYSVNAQTPYIAIDSLMNRPEVIQMSGGTLPPIPPITGPNLTQEDKDGDQILISKSYKDKSVIHILNDLAFSSGLSWEFIIGQDQIVTNKWTFDLFTAIDSPFDDLVTLGLPASYKVTVAFPHDYRIQTKWHIAHLHSVGLSRLQILNKICNELGLLFVLVAPTDQLLDSKYEIDISDCFFDQLIDKLFPGYTLSEDIYSGIIIIQPVTNERSNAIASILNREIKAQLSVQGNCSDILLKINVLLSNYVKKPLIRIVTIKPITDCAFSMTAPWRKRELTPLLIIEGIARKTLTSSIINVNNTSVVANIGILDAKTPYIFIFHVKSNCLPLDALQP